MSRAPLKRLAVVTAALVFAVGICMVLVVPGARAVLGIGASDTGDAAFVAYPSYAQASNYHFVSGEYAARAKAGYNPRFVFGSSELSPRHGGAMNPSKLLLNGEYGISTLTVGRATCESLWQAVEMGALGGTTGQDRSVLFASMQWFMCYRAPQDHLPAMFSRDAYDAFMENDHISADLKERVTQRLGEYGVRVTKGSSPFSSFPDTLDRTMTSAVDDARLRLENNRAAVPSPRAPSAAPSAPDWAGLETSATRSLAATPRNKTFAVDENWYQKRGEAWLKGAKATWKVRGGEYFSQQEYEDFKMALAAGVESGMVPLVVIQPVNGFMYDQTAYTASVRQEYYAMIRRACEEAGVPYVDFSSHEYDKNFFQDYSHPSEYGALLYSQAVYNYLKD